MKRSRVVRISPNMSNVIKEFQLELSTNFGRKVEFTEASDILATKIKKRNVYLSSFNWFD